VGARADGHAMTSRPERGIDERRVLRCCAAIWVVVFISSCCAGGLKKKVEDAHLRSGGAVGVFKWGYPVIGVGYRNVYVATCNVVWREADCQIVEAESWWSDFFCMTRDEFAGLELRLSAMSDGARLAREEGFLAGMRGDHLDKALVSDEFLVGYQAAVDVKKLDVLHVNYY